MEKKNKRSDILRLAGCGIVAVLWFTFGLFDIPKQGGAALLSFFFAIAFSVKFFLELRKYQRSWEKKS